MADQHNANIPAMGNQISADIPDIKENLEFHRDAFQLMFETWSDTDNSSNVFDSAFGWSDGTYTYDFPTNGIAGHSVIMLGNSSTIAWFYLNAAPPGWKVLTTGADSVIAVSGGTGDYNVNGGNADTAASWDMDGLTNGNQSASHTHTLAASGTQGSAELGQRVAIDDGKLYMTSSDGNTYAAASSVTGNQSASHSHTISSDSTYRPKASVGKLYQLDTA